MKHLGNTFIPAAVLAASLASSAAVAAQGEPWKHPDGTTHYYEAVAVPGGITWDAANVAANTAGGYLATITSPAENALVFALIDDARFWTQQNVGPWVGGLQTPGAAEPGGGWVWSELEPFTYFNWAQGQPNDQGGADRVCFGGGSGRVATWADEPLAALLLGYVIERSGPTAPLTAGLLQRDAASSDGYTLLAPINTSATFLIDARGRVVNTWVSTYAPGLSAYLLPNGNLLRTGRVGNTKFTIGGNGGIIEEYDWSGALVWTYQYSSSSYCQHHDIARLPNGNVLLIAWEEISQQEAIAAGRDPALLTSGVLYPDKIVEVQPTGPTTGQIVWEWRAWDHLIQDFDPTKANYGVVGQHPERIDLNYPPPGQVGSGIHDWLHSNAIDYNATLDQIVLSARHFNELWIIDHSTTTAEAATSSGGRSGKGGDLLYRWGNPVAYRAGTAQDRKLFQQHDTHWVPDNVPGGGNIMIFDNGVERPVPEYSTVVEITPPVPDAKGNYPRPSQAWGPPQATWTYQATNPPSFFSRFVSGAQRLANGNTLICGGWIGEMFEVTPQGQTVWRYVCPIGIFGPLLQGDVPTGNQLFRSPRYDPSYAAFSGKVLVPSEPLELHPTALLADGSAVAHTVPVGGSVTWSVRSSGDAGRIYLLGSSNTAGITAVDQRFLRVGNDELLILSMSGAMPTVFQNYSGTLDAGGRATATLSVPAIPALAGIDLYTTFAVIDFNAPRPVVGMANAVAVKIVP